jgi:hypothetical protein
MSKNTCQSVVVYEVQGENLVEPFRMQRHQKAIEMFREGKCAGYPSAGTNGIAQLRCWIDRAAAQEFIDYITPLAESYGIRISTTIEDL